jgi:hypothetical protein
MIGQFVESEMNKATSIVFVAVDTFEFRTYK